MKIIDIVVFSIGVSAMFLSWLLSDIIVLEASRVLAIGGLFASVAGFIMGKMAGMGKPKW